MIISIQKKQVVKFKHPFLILKKKLSRSGIEVNLLNLIRGIYEKTFFIGQGYCSVVRRSSCTLGETSTWDRVLDSDRRIILDQG